MPTTKRFAGGLCLCLTALFLVSCLSGKRQNRSDRETYAKAVLASVQLDSAFNYEVAEVVPIADSASRQERWLCYLFGGPPTSAVGAVGVFDLAGKLLDATSLKGLHAYDTNASVLAQGDSVILRTLDASGTGLHIESLVVLTLTGGKLLETFRCSGLCYSIHGEFYDQEVQLSFGDLNGDSMPELIRMVTANRYASSVDQENDKPIEAKSIAEVFEFDTLVRRYVRAFE